MRKPTPMTWRVWWWPAGVPSGRERDHLAEPTEAEGEQAVHRIDTGDAPARRQKRLIGQRACAAATGTQAERPALIADLHEGLALPTGADHAGEPETGRQLGACRLARGFSSRTQLSLGLSWSKGIRASNRNGLHHLLGGGQWCERHWRRRRGGGLGRIRCRCSRCGSRCRWRRSGGVGGWGSAADQADQGQQHHSRECATHLQLNPAGDQRPAPRDPGSDPDWPGVPW